MDQYYLILLAFLGVIALIDLFVGVSNDAVNFLNSALGCRITSFRTTLWVASLGVLAGATFSSGMMEIARGVSNDAVNFLNSALGCRITSFRTTLWVASLGVLAGATFSSGMMEIARSGVFHPQLFTFSELMIIFFAVMVADVILLDAFNAGATFSSGMMEIARSGVFHPQLFTFSELMIIFFAVMVADVILLDAFNSMGLPTSTTVSIVFELLGSAFAAALFKLIDAGLPLTDVANYINSSKSLGIVSGILISVVVAFISGAVVQYLARLAFSFRFENAYRRIGAIYGGLALTAIIYFLVMKGAKGASFMRPEWISWINDNTAAILFTLFAGLTVFFQILIVVFRVNIFKIIILAGTFSLAFAFAGNDLVNFVGVPLAAWDSFQAWKASGVADTEFLMGGLLKPATAPTAFLLLSGFVMVLTLWFSKKAHRVIQTSINLSSSQSGGQEQFDATTPGRMIVRAAMSVGNVVHQIIPLPIQRGIQKRFEPLPVVKGEVPLPFDYVRASINLMVSAILIASATSLKLPLSTTYVTFMVAMGSSFADGAWDRESAVYRISGVLTVISGWFLTAISASSLAAVVAVIVFWGGEVAAILLGVGAVFMLVRSNLKTQNEGDITPKEARQVYNAAGVKTILANIHAKSLAQSLSLLTQILEGFTADAQRELTRIRNAAEDLHEEATTARKLTTVWLLAIASRLKPTLTRVTSTCVRRPTREKWREPCKISLAWPENTLLIVTAFRREVSLAILRPWCLTSSAWLR